MKTVGQLGQLHTYRIAKKLFLTILYKHAIDDYNYCVNKKVVLFLEDFIAVGFFLRAHFLDQCFKIRDRQPTAGISVGGLGARRPGPTQQSADGEVVTQPTHGTNE